MPNKPAHKDDPFKGIKSGSWTKWGGARRGLIHSQAEELWSCQLCGEQQPMSLAGFFIEDEVCGEHLKVCALCFSKARQTNYSFRRTLIQVRGVDTKVIDEEIANLLTAWKIR